MSQSSPGQRLVDYAFRFGWAITRHTPEPAAQRVLESAADRIWRQRGDGVAQLEANLRRAAPGVGEDALRELSRQAMRSYFRYWHEAFRMPSWSHERIVDTVVTTNETALRTIHARGKGAIVALPHMANWDLAGAWASLTGMPVSTVAERLRPESLFRRFVEYRVGLGIEVVPLSSGASALAAMRQALDANRVVCLLADRTVTSGTGGTEVDLLGERALLPGGPAALSRLSGVPIVVCVPTYRGNLLHLRISDPIDPVPGRDGVAATMQAVADEFSAGIGAAPQDWHMLQAVFVRDVDAQHRPGPA